eukprot:31176-Pelagococcus_subviridis.AAC.53
MRTSLCEVLSNLFLHSIVRARFPSFTSRSATSVVSASSASAIRASSYYFPVVFDPELVERLVRALVQAILQLGDELLETRGAGGDEVPLVLVVAFLDFRFQRLAEVARVENVTHRETTTRPSRRRAR